jgi:hypothetical protein
MYQEKSIDYHIVQEKKKKNYILLTQQITTDQETKFLNFVLVCACNFLIIAYLLIFR